MSQIRTQPAPTTKRRQQPSGIGGFIDSWLWVAVHIGALIPLALLIWGYIIGDLTANPIQFLTQRTGKAALVLLVLSLACTPLNILLGWKRVTAFRKPLGLYAFMYAAIHLFIFTVLDYGLDWSLIWNTVAEKPYVIAGFSAFMLLLPLALTSTKFAMRRLGKRWKALHRLVYVAAGLVIVHFVWVVKADIREPLLYGVAVALLLATRLPPVRRAISAARSRLFPPKAKPARRSAPDADSAL